MGDLREFPPVLTDVGVMPSSGAVLAHEIAPVSVGEGAPVSVGAGISLEERCRNTALESIHQVLDERDELSSNFEQPMASFNELHAISSEMHGVVQSRDAQIVCMKDALDSSEEQRKALEVEVVQLRAASEQACTAAAVSAAADAVSTATANAAAQEAERSVAQFQIALGKQNRTISSQNTRLRKKNTELRTLRTQIREKDETIQQLAESCATKDATIDQLAAQLACAQARIDAQTGHPATQTPSVVHIDAQIATQTQSAAGHLPVPPPAMSAGNM